MFRDLFVNNARRVRIRSMWMARLANIHRPRSMFLPVLTMFLIGTFSVQADPLIGNSQNVSQPAVLGEHKADSGWGVHGKSDRGTGVVGTSTTWHGVHGRSKNSIGTSGFSDTGAGVEGQSKTWYGTYGKSEDASGIFGTSTKGAGVEGQSTSWIGVYGATKSNSAAGGEFQNSGGGDLIRGGANGAFRVLNNGDVLVRGQKIGATGPQGPQGLKGDPGPPGPVSRAGCMCSWQSISPITNQCGAPGGSGRATGGIAECVRAAQQASVGACNIQCPDM